MDNWNDIQGNNIDVFEVLEEYKNSKNILIHIGTDAQAKGRGKANFVTVVCVHTITKGGRIFYWEDRKVPTYSLWDKLYGETERSLRVAVALTDHFGHEFASRICVHVDANPNPVYASSSYVKQLAGMVMGYGFKHVLKPDAWAASHAADHLVKGKHHRS